MHVHSHADLLALLQGTLTTVETEYTDQPLPVEGELPPALDGVLFRNGGGRFERGGQRYSHPFDGDGHVVRIDIGAGGARYTNRFVRTEEWLAEEASGRMRYRGFGTNMPGGIAGNLLRPFKNAANTNVVWHGGRLLALWEGGLPHRLDPQTLATVGPEDFQGRLRRQDRGPGHLLPFSAHPSIDAETGELVNFGIAFGRPHRLMLYRVSADGRMAEPQAYPLPRFSFVHDIAVTRRWLCVLLPQADFRVLPALLGLRSPVASLRLATDQPMQAMLIPRGGGDVRLDVRLIEAAPGFVFHIAQAFDEDDGRLTIDVVRYRDYPAFDDLAGLFAEDAPDSLPRLERIVLDPETGRCTLDPWSERGFELPTTAPSAFGARRRIIYGVGAPADRRVPYLSGIQRLDTETRELTTLDLGRDLPGEPVLAAGGRRLPASGADATDEGWLLSLVNRTTEGRSDLLILRAADLGIQATVRLPHVVPPGFHGCWVERRELCSD